MKLVNAIEKSGLSLVDTKDQALRTRLIAAGYTSPGAPRAYTLLRLTLVIGLPVLLLGWMWLSGSRPSVTKLYFFAIGAAVIGLYGPSLFIRVKADRRQREIINGFPDALDLMLVCVEAGLGLEAAFARVGQEMTAVASPAVPSNWARWCSSCAPGAAARMRCGGWPTAPGPTKSGPSRRC